MFVVYSFTTVSRLYQNVALGLQIPQEKLKSHFSGFQGSFGLRKDTKIEHEILLKNTAYTEIDGLEVIYFDIYVTMKAFLQLLD